MDMVYTTFISAENWQILYIDID